MSSVIIYPVVTDTPTLVNSWNTAFSVPITLRKKGDMAFIAGFISRSSAPAQESVIFTVPADFRPKSIIFLPCQDSTSFYQGRIDIQTNGNVTFAFGNPTSYLGVNSTYILF